MIKSAQEIIQDIVDVLNEADGEFIERIANQVLINKVTYKEDSIFHVDDFNQKDL